MGIYKGNIYLCGGSLLLNALWTSYNRSAVLHKGDLPGLACVSEDFLGQQTSSRDG